MKVYSPVYISPQIPRTVDPIGSNWRVVFWEGPQILQQNPPAEDQKHWVGIGKLKSQYLTGLKQK